MAQDMMPFLGHLQSPGSLVTPYEQVRAGFVSLALEKGRRATPFIAQARALKVAGSGASKPVELLAIKDIRLSLLCAAGVSDKAAKHMNEADREEAITGLITKFLEPAGNAFVEELVFRFLLTRGDTLGGSMRNVGGEMAQRKMSQAIIAALSLAKSRSSWLSSTNRTWTQTVENQPDIELYAVAINWSAEGKPRTVVYNRRVPLVNKNVDFSLLECAIPELKSACKDPSSYIALGELKGGIDPAGADEHWKTASAHLARIRKAFSENGLSPQIFFVGAAIEQAMSVEIWEQLEAGTLANAANLTSPDQVASLCRWLCSL